MTKHKFQIGDLVLVKGGILLEYERNDTMPGRRYQRRVARRPLEVASQFQGVVTGATFRSEGFTDYGYGEEGGKYFIPKKQVPLWLVRRTVTSAEHLVFEEDLELVKPVFHGEGGESLIPWKTGQVVSQVVRDELREIMKDWPRDKGGHWLRRIPPNCRRCGDTGRLGNDILCDCEIGRRMMEVR